MNKKDSIREELKMKIKRIAQWEKTHTIPKITQTVRIMDPRSKAPGLGAMR